MLLKFGRGYEERCFSLKGKGKWMDTPFSLLGHIALISPSSLLSQGHKAGFLIFRAVAELRISSKSAKSREIHKNTRNPAKFARNLTKSWLLGLLTCCKLAKLPWNFVTAACKQQRCKNPGVPSVDRGNWGWECDSLFYRVLALREECCVLWRITPYICTFISPSKMTIFSERFGLRMIMSENLQNEQSSRSFSRSR